MGGKDQIAAMQAAERERTGITSLKIGYNKVFGYYIEITNAQQSPRFRRTTSDDRRCRAPSGT